MDLWMPIEGTKLIFVMNFSLLHFFKFASRMPQISQILVSTFKIFQEGEWWEGACPWTPLEISSFFFISNSRLCVNLFWFHFSNICRWAENILNMLMSLMDGRILLTALGSGRLLTVQAEINVCFESVFHKKLCKYGFDNKPWLTVFHRLLGEQPLTFAFLHCFLLFWGERVTSAFPRDLFMKLSFFNGWLYSVTQ